MSFDYALISGLNLHVLGRIAAEDAARQTATAAEILSRLNSRPGVILADEVGMGKTFVALAVAASVAHADQRPVIVMVPPSVKDKWPRDFGVFRERCLEPQVARLLRHRAASNGVELLKLLDDPPDRRAALIFLTHGAMSTRLGDTWVKLAIIQRAVKHRKNIDKLREAIARFAGELLRARWYAPDVWSSMLRSPPESWAQILAEVRSAEPPEDIAVDDPVPRAIVDALEQVDLEEVFAALQGIPQRDSAHFKQRMSGVRSEVEKAVKGVWERCIQLHRSRLPLLILDEAHHLKNPSTQLSSLFDSEEAEEDAQQLAGGPLAGVFERMLFLTATPFQLGHHELCNVLNRFSGVAWSGRTAPLGGRTSFEQEMNALRERLDSAQQAALQLDYVWGKLTPEDLVVSGERYEDSNAWWKALMHDAPSVPRVVQALDRFKFAQGELRSAELALRPWVIRHSRPLTLSGTSNIPRRRRIVGAGIRKFEDGYRDLLEPGLELDEGNALPFLLAARLVSLTPETRPVFAEGLASSYEAFLETRVRRQAETAMAEVDEDGTPTVIAKLDGAASWYLEQTTEAVQQRGKAGDNLHPKVSATVERAMALWRRGEKVLIFCHYIATGRVLRAELSNRMRREIQELATRKIRCRQAEAEKELERIGRRFDRGSPSAKACLEEAGRVLTAFPALSPYRSRIEEILLRFIRTPSFLVRYFGLTEGTTSGRAVSRAFAEKDGSGISIVQIVRDFHDFLATRCSEEEREAYIDAVDEIQTGSHIGRDAVRGAAEDELAEDSGESFVANVRLINGRTRADTRRRLMLAFNTPFYPEILIASSVMAEGVDLHLNCRHVIHHDLSWNPSVLEQRTGRVDRIGARAERAGQPINVFFPYVAETQDEKMYRVVMDRERWFQVVMGANQRLAVLATAGGADRIAARIPLPQAALADLVFRLGL